MILNLIRRLFWRFRPGVFRFWDGKRWRDADPLAVYYDLFSDDWLGADPDFHLTRAERGEETSIKVVIAGTRKVLGIPSLADGGLSDLEVLAIFRQFVLYTEVLKKNIGTRLVWLPFLDATSIDLSDETESDSLPSDSLPHSSADDRPSECEKAPTQPSTDPLDTGSKT